MRTRRVGYALLCGLVLAIEVAIAALVDDAWVRPLLGDSLAVVLVYLGLRAVFPLSVREALAVALLIAFALEFGQLFDLRNVVGLGRGRLAPMVLGSTFDLRDLLAYVLGAMVLDWQSIGCVRDKPVMPPRLAAWRRGRSYAAGWKTAEL